eukprot:5664709-Prymnesium_polylepis.2
MLGAKAVCATGSCGRRLGASKMRLRCAQCAWRASRATAYVASFESDCLPEPPTPTRSAWPPGDSMMRLTREMWRIASSNRTRSICPHRQRSICREHPDERDSNSCNVPRRSPRCTRPARP